MARGTPLPPTRTVLVDVLVPAGWVRGTCHVPQTQSLFDFLAHGTTFVKLTEVELPGQPEPLPFFAIQRGSVQLLAPREAADHEVETPGAPGLTSPWNVTCLLERGALQGRLDFLQNQRLSDYLRAQTGFLVVRDAVWAPLPPGDEVGERRWSIVLAHVPQLIGVAESRDQRGHGHPGKLPPSEFD